MFPKKKYKIIYADPPWLFRVRSEKGNTRSATNHYDVMSIQDIKNMPVQDIADEVVIMDRGKVFKSGKVKILKDKNIKNILAV